MKDYKGKAGTCIRKKWNGDDFVTFKTASACQSLTFICIKYMASSLAVVHILHM